MRLAGGDAAARDTRALRGRGDVGDGPGRRAAVRRMEAGDCRADDRPGICVTSTAAGQVFDGVAALLGLCGENTHEAQAAMALESLASTPEHRETAEPRSVMRTNESDGSASAPLELVLVKWPGGPDRTRGGFHDQFARAWAKAVAAGRRTGLRS